MDLCGAVQDVANLSAAALLFLGFSIVGIPPAFLAGVTAFLFDVFADSRHLLPALIGLLAARSGRPLWLALFWLCAAAAVLFVLGNGMLSTLGGARRPDFCAEAFQFIRPALLSAVVFTAAFLAARSVWKRRRS